MLRCGEMKADTFRQVIGSTKPPLSVYTSDGRQVYVDHPELVIVGENLVAIGLGADAASGVVKEIVLLSPEHIVRIEPTKRRALIRTK
jgi:hypothetical protein